MNECDTLLMIGSAFPYAEFLPKEGKARGVQIDIDASMLSIRFPMEVGLVGDAAETLRALLPRLRQKQAGKWRQTIEDNVRELVEDARGACQATRQAGQSAARDLGIVAAAAGSGGDHQRFRLLRQLVRARPQDPPRHEGLALRRPGLDGRRRSLCDRRQICAAGSPRHCVGRRWRNADEQYGRADHGRQILARLARPSLDRLRLQQRRSQPGDMGAAHHQR